jgi:hypothetical protein
MSKTPFFRDAALFGASFKTLRLWDAFACFKYLELCDRANVRNGSIPAGRVTIRELWLNLLHRGDCGHPIQRQLL